MSEIDQAYKTLAIAVAEKAIRDLRAKDPAARLSSEIWLLSDLDTWLEALNEEPVSGASFLAKNFTERRSNGKKYC